MNQLNHHKLDPKLDLVLERIVDVSPELVWSAWTNPKHLVEWFTPAPWKTIDCEVDLRPGGIFRTTMQSPEGEDFPNIGCYLEVIPNQRLIWTDALLPGFRPSPRRPMNSMDFITAIITIEAHGKGTKYTAIAIHGTEQARKTHEEMGFYDGWGKATDQLVEFSKGWKI
ncbi:polyketide cyclase [Leptospira perolatii]|uniref:Polyketide cyclase n=1 Tax=Leptospira perolatii TaxID=2023191 RepID=A0A2M9ZQ12_9LEPT|nr:SRPBCC family protein [Leptospira perolatii]PJZ68253.1 polyketide cyclase [Leptospira perolatii]PJZ74178.1 polyketide cyclase [Leptospira perolatii]